jgi:hypothetical protein
MTVKNTTYITIYKTQNKELYKYPCNNLNKRNVPIPTVAHDTLMGHPIISATVTNTNADCTFQNYLCWWSIK